MQFGSATPSIVVTSTQVNIRAAEEPKQQPQRATAGGLPLGSPVKEELPFSEISAGDLGWEEGSMSGYSAHSGKVATDAEGHHSSNYYRLVRYYEKYNPEKIPRAEEFLVAYKGEEEQLFQMLVSKYGPEPPGNPRCENGSFSSHPRSLLPVAVAPVDGNTDCVTPYWPGNKQVMDTDLLSLLRQLKTDNVELQKCFLGVLSQHPNNAFNGMCYVTRAVLPADASESFLGHMWSGSLANNKFLVFDGRNFQRTVLHCTAACQQRARAKGGESEESDGKQHHERWRLTIIRSDNNNLVLFRTIWDSVIVAPSMDVKKTSFTSMSANSCTGQQVVVSSSSKDAVVANSNWGDLEEKALPKRKHTKSSNSAASSASSAVSGGLQVQPTQPPILASAAVPVSDVMGLLKEMESRIISRLDSMELRIQRLEGVKQNFPQFS